MVDYKELEAQLLELEEVAEVEIYENADGTVVKVTYSEPKDEYIRLLKAGLKPAEIIYQTMEDCGMEKPSFTPKYGVQFGADKVYMTNVEVE